MQALDLGPSTDEVRAEVITALSGPQKMLPSKLFYDEYGSRLFDEICDLPEYYPTRTELKNTCAIMHGRRIAAGIKRSGPGRSLSSMGVAAAPKPACFSTTCGTLLLTFPSISPASTW